MIIGYCWATLMGSLGPRDSSNLRVAKFRNVIEGISLIEMATQGGMFTWTNGLVGNIRCISKLD